MYSEGLQVDADNGNTGVVSWYHLPAGGTECGTVSHQGCLQQTERSAKEDRTAAVREHQRDHLRSLQVDQKYNILSTEIILNHANGLGPLSVILKTVSIGTERFSSPFPSPSSAARPKSRKSSKADVLAASGDEHMWTPSQADLGVLQHFFSSLPPAESPQRSSTSTQSEALSVIYLSIYLSFVIHVLSCVCPFSLHL